jgi:hypothetical protein
MPASARAARPNPACLVRTDRRPELSEKPSMPRGPPGTKSALPHCEYVKVHMRGMGNVIRGSGCQLPALRGVLRGDRPDGHGFCTQSCPPRHGASLGKARRARRQRSPTGRGIGRNPLKALQSRKTRFPPPANLNRPTAWNVLIYRWGESVPRTPERVIQRRVVAASSSPALIGIRQT